MPLDEKVARSGFVVTGVVKQARRGTDAFEEGSYNTEFVRVRVGLQLKGAIESRDIDILVYHARDIRSYTPLKIGATYLFFLEPARRPDGAYAPVYGRFGVYQVYPKAEAPPPLPPGRTH